MQLMKRIAGLIGLCLFAGGAWSQDVERGRVLYETHCGGCHYDRVHERKNSAITELSGLRDMVARWSRQTKRSYELDELDDIVHYLNASHYRFPLESRDVKRPEKKE